MKRDAASKTFSTAGRKARMSAGKMHADEVDTDIDLVVQLLAAQFPHWAGLPMMPVPSAGADNVLYRLGHDRVVRLPRIDWAIGDVEKEQQWLPKLAPFLPLAIPVLPSHSRAGIMPANVSGP